MRLNKQMRKVMTRTFVSPDYSKIASFAHNTLSRRPKFARLVPRAKVSFLSAHDTSNLNRLSKSEVQQHNNQTHRSLPLEPLFSAHHARKVVCSYVEELINVDDFGCHRWMKPQSMHRGIS